MSALDGRGASGDDVRVGPRPSDREPAGHAPRRGGRLGELSLRELEAFLAVVEHGGFTAAARSTHVSQPGLSARIQRLERALGALVIDRSVRRLTLTEEGRAFLPVAERVLADLDAAGARIREQRRTTGARA